jgi:hypothetical protein
MKKPFKLFLISLLVGFTFELLMAKVWQYNMLTYFLGVPIMIVLAWSVLLPLGYFIVNKYEKKTKFPFWLNLLFLYIPMIIIIEFIGTNVLHWQLNKIYPALIGNFMKAPIPIYIAYYLITLFVYKN